MEHSEYSEIPAVNWSSLKAMATSPRAYQWYLEHPPEDKPAWALGRAVHAAILEPEKFAARYVVRPADLDLRTKAGKAWKSNLNPDLDLLSAADGETVNICVDAVQAHPHARDLLTGGRAEELLQWTDPTTGMACKGRLDYITPDRFIDLKTTRDPTPRWFASDFARYLYHGQVAFYLDGCQAAGLLPGDEFTPEELAARDEDTGEKLVWGSTRASVVAVQTVAPYDVAVYEISPSALDAGRHLYHGLLGQLVACQAADIWPGCAPEPIVLELPHWAPGMTEDEEVL